MRFITRLQGYKKIHAQLISIVGILAFMSRNNIILGLSEPEFLDNFRLMGIENFMLSCVEYGKNFITSGPGRTMHL